MSIQSKLEIEKQSIAETLKSVEKKLNDEKSKLCFYNDSYTIFCTKEYQMHLLIFEKKSFRQNILKILKNIPPEYSKFRLLGITC